ncbi:TIGR01777 family protein [Synechococcales cyanobacterium C]|uniref:TIGR01777 family protein n=1 Tax=Petrachloros mirabilis ULC683 TaxID=2781853 RepID=A0A8K2A6V3_9CYAN|nr:TIGR01777 family oxidoreductase [Petrachloros mirabilis]NCJ05435.1 TIGR01777 family protein [Petrachloros mirabilis ULC683]
MKVAITGATGFVGHRLVPWLHNEGHELVLLVRKPQKATRLFPAAQFTRVKVVPYTPLQSGDWQAKISACDGVVNLAGEPISERWTPESKKAILNSRQLGTAKLVEAITQAAVKPQVMVSASAIGYYGTSETTTFDETSASGQDFLAQVCQAWEAAAAPVTEMGLRLAILRIGIVLGPEGGALAKMIPPFQLFAGGPIGSGKQWVSWIHREDLVRLIGKALTDANLSGVYNATAPQPVRMQEFCQVLGDVLHRPSWLPVPDFALELLLGEGAKLVLEGQQVQAKRTLAAGFTFEYPAIAPALKQILS